MVHVDFEPFGGPMAKAGTPSKGPLRKAGAAPQDANLRCQTAWQFPWRIDQLHSPSPSMSDRGAVQCRRLHRKVKTPSGQSC